MNFKHYFKRQKKLIEFRRYDAPGERHFRCGDRQVTLLIYAEGKRTFESPCAIDSRNIDWPYPMPEPTVHYLALMRVKHDPAGQLEPGRFVKVRAFECEELGFGDTERLYVKARPGVGEHFPKLSRIILT